MQKNLERSGSQMMIKKLIEEKKIKILQKHMTVKEETRNCGCSLSCSGGSRANSAELAQKAHTTQSTIARIERGDNVSFDKLDDIASIR